MRYLFFCLLLSFSLNTALADAPVLIDLTVTGTLESTNLEPREINLIAGKEYVLVLNNPKNFSVTFRYGKFGQGVYTHLLQGTSNVNQDGFHLMPISKVTWHFVPKEVGEFQYSVISSGMNLQGQGGTLIVKKEEFNANVLDKQAEPQSTVDFAGTAK